MTKKIAKIKRSALRNIFAAFSFTTALFVFQACYGVPQDWVNELVIEGTVRAEKSGLPINNIELQLTINNGDHKVYTDSTGVFIMYTLKQEQLAFSIKDIDEELNGRYAPKDTILIPAQDSNHISIDILLNEL